mgnify:FL=1
MNQLLAPLVKSAKTLIDLVTVYLFITWTYAGIDFLIRSIF